MCGGGGFEQAICIRKNNQEKCVMHLWWLYSKGFHLYILSIIRQICPRDARKSTIAFAILFIYYCLTMALYIQLYMRCATHTPKQKIILGIDVVKNSILAQTKSQLKYSQQAINHWWCAPSNWIFLFFFFFFQKVDWILWHAKNQPHAENISTTNVCGI